MNIGGISAVTDAAGVISPVSSPAQTQSAAPSETQGAATLSPPALLLSGLQRLAEVDPSKLADIANGASQKLRTAATSASGSAAQGLTSLANAFSQVASTGNVSALHQVASSQRGHHHASSYPTAAAGAASGDAQSTLAAVSEEVEQAMGMNPPPYGPWGNEQ